MAFPRLSNFLEYTKLDSEDYRVINYMTGEEWTVDKKTVRCLRRFDGTRPFKKCFPGYPPDEIQELYEEIEDNINDLHRGNYGLSREGMPILIDIGGYDSERWSQDY